MAKKWKDLDIQSIAKKAAKETDRKLASQILALREIPDDELKALFPDKSDQKKVAELMKIVKSSDDRNTKINRLMEKSEKFVGVIKKLLAKV